VGFSNRFFAAHIWFATESDATLLSICDPCEASNHEHLFTGANVVVDGFSAVLDAVVREND